MRTFWNFDKRGNVLIWLCRSSVTCLIAFQVIILSQSLITRRTLVATDKIIHQSNRMNDTYIDFSNETTSLESHTDKINITNEATLQLPILILDDVPDQNNTTEMMEMMVPNDLATDEPSFVYTDSFPLEPLYNIDSILDQSIGRIILQDQNQNPMRNCSPTVQFQLYAGIKKIDDIDTTEYTIQTMMMEKNIKQNDEDGNRTMKVVPKQLGGDEIYVEWVSSEDPNDMGVAMISDEDNGRYRLKFVRPPLLQLKYDKKPTAMTRKNGRLTIYYDYTCGIGSMFAPGKNQFRRAGEIRLSFRNKNIPRPFIHDFVPPNIGTEIDNDTETTKIDLSKYHTIISFGDSVMMQFVRRFKKPEFWSNNMHYQKNMIQCLSNSSSDAVTAMQKFNQWHGPLIQNITVQHNQSVAVIIGSAVWDAMRGCVRSDFDGHRTTIRQFVSALRTKYPLIDLYWKSPSALMLHRRGTLEDVIDNALYLQQSRYISDGIIRQINVVQKALMKELDVPFLDLFDAYYLSAPWSLPGDARHYEDSVSSLLFSYYWPGLQQTYVYSGPSKR